MDVAVECSHKDAVLWCKWAYQSVVEVEFGMMVLASLFVDRKDFGFLDNILLLLVACI